MCEWYVHVPPTSEAVHCCHAGIQGVLDAYKFALTNVKLWGPTNAAPIINHVARFAEQADKNPEAQVSSDAVCVLVGGGTGLRLPAHVCAHYRTTSSC